MVQRSASARAASQVSVATAEPTETLMELIEVIWPFGPRATASKESPARTTLLPFNISGGKLMLFAV